VLLKVCFIIAQDYNYGNNMIRLKLGNFITLGELLVLTFSLK